MVRLLLLVLAGAPLVAQQTTALFDAPVVQMPDDSAPFQQLFDFDGDGDQDAVGGRVKSDGSDYEVRVWRNQGGRYVLAYTDLQAAVGGGGSNIVTGDFDNDGDRDFLFGTGFAIYRYTNTTGTWSRSTFASFPITSGQRLGSLAAGDFDGNGSLDVAAFIKDPTIPAAPGELRLLLAGGALVTSVLPAIYTLSTAIKVLQADGDAALEVAIWDASGSNRFQPFDLVAGGLVPMAPLAAALATQTQIALWATGDIDGDGDADVVAFETPSATAPARVHCFRRTGTTTFAAEPAYLGGPAEFLLDIDGDGDLDGACCGGGGGGSPYWPMVDYGSTFELALNDGQGTFARSFTMAGKGSTRMAGATDVDLDGFVDLVAGAAVYYGRGSFVAATSPPVALLDSPNLLFAVRRLGAQLGDFDRDGDVDFLSTLQRQGVNDGSGAWRLEPTTMATLPPGVAVGTPHFRGDFDGDGAVDYVVKVRIGGQFSHTAFLRNNGSGVLFYAGVAAAAAIGGPADAPGGGDTAALTADFDGDGDIDIVANTDAACQWPYRSDVWWNQGNGTFAPGPQFATERIESAADFDGDGRPDLLTRAANGAPTVRLGTGVSATPFGPPIPALPQQSYDLYSDTFQVVDANDDGRRDILARTSPVNGTNGFLLLCNTTTAVGQPAFQPAIGLLPPGNLALGSVVVMDVDGDQRNDLVQMSPQGATFTARIRLRLSGDGQVLQNAHYGPPVEQVIWDGFAADVDADGDLDLVGNRVVRNARRHGSAAGLRLQYGTGSPGEAGVVPLFGIGPTVRAGDWAEYRLSGVTGPTIAVLAVSLAQAQLPNVPSAGVTCLVDPSASVIGLFLLAEDGGGQARGGATIPVFFQPGLQGAQFFDQIFVLDPSVPSWFAASNGLQKVIGG